MAFKRLWSWIGQNTTQLKVVIPALFVIVGGGWTAYLYFNSEQPVANVDPVQDVAVVSQNHSGHGDNVGGDKIVHTRNPQDRGTIDNLNAALELYQAQLEAKNVTQRELEQQINGLRGALQLAQSIVRGGGALASAAQTLLDTFIAKPDDPALPAQFDALIARYQNGPIQDMIALYLGRGAVSYYGDTQALKLNKKLGHKEGKIWSKKFPQSSNRRHTMRPVITALLIF
ncbi:hypothetical protein GN278_14815 [Rhodobacteraceae bacterium Araon29]